MGLIAHPAPQGAYLAEGVTVVADGVSLPVHSTPVGLFALCTADDGPISLEITLPGPPGSVVVRPQRPGAAARSEGNRVRCVLPGPGRWTLVMDQCNPLHIFAEASETSIPDRNDPAVHWFEAGRVHDVDVIRLKSNETLYIEAGAMVRSTVEAVDAENVRICGRGILDGRHLGMCDRRLMLFDRCKNVHIEGIVGVGTPSWTTVLGACENVEIHDLKLIGWNVGSDGVDVCGCRNVHIHDCFLRDNDDCVVVKSTGYQNDPLRWARDVEGVLVERCILYNDRAGNAMEIGFETRTESIRNITFRDIDVIAAHGEGAVFSIHLGDRATVENVLFEDMRIEHFYDKLVDFRIIRSRWSHDAERGHIRGVTLRRIDCIADIYNSPSLIGGYDEAHLVEDVLFKDFRMGGEPVLDADALGLYIKHARGIRFEP